MRSIFDTCDLMRCIRSAHFSDYSNRCSKFKCIWFCIHILNKICNRLCSSFSLSLQLLQNLGKVDRTADEIFDEHLTNFNRQQNNAARLQKEFNNYIRCVRGKFTSTLSSFKHLSRTKQITFAPKISCSGTNGIEIVDGSNFRCVRNTLDGCRGVGCSNPIDRCAMARFFA